MDGLNLYVEGAVLAGSSKYSVTGMWKAERGYLGSHRGLVGKYKRLSGSCSMDSPYCSSCSRFGLGRIQEGGWERDL